MIIKHELVKEAKDHGFDLVKSYHSKTYFKKRYDNVTIYLTIYVNRYMVPEVIISGSCGCTEVKLSALLNSANELTCYLDGVYKILDTSPERKR